MTVASTVRRNVYNYIAGQTVFQYTFPALEKSHIEVYVLPTGQTSPTLLVNGVDYTVFGEGNDAGGNVTLAVATTGTGTLTILREVPLTQPTDFKNQGSFFPRTHERAFDRVTMLAQQIAEEIGRSLRLPIDSAGVSTELPPPSVGSVFGWNDTLTGIRNVTIADAGTGIYAPGFAGALPSRLVAEKLRESVSVKDFGAVGDGVADDTLAIKRALASTDNVRFPGGEYLVTETIVLLGALNYQNTNAKALHFDDGVTVRKAGNAVGDSAYDAVFAIKKRPGAGECYNVRIYGRPIIHAAASDYGIVYESAGGKHYVEGATVLAKTTVFCPVNIWQSQWDDLMLYPSVTGFLMAAAGTSNVLNRPFVFGSTDAAYELRGDYSTINSPAADACTGTVYRFRFANWAVNGAGCESPLAAIAIEAGNNSNITASGGTLVALGSSAIFSVSPDSILTITGTVVGFAYAIATREGRLYSVDVGGRLTLANVEVFDTFTLASIGKVNQTFATEDGTQQFNGVRFPSPATPSTDPATLDDYREGTWDVFLSGSGGGSLALGTGRFTKIGRMVHCSVFAYNVTGSGFSGNARMSLPFAPAARDSAVLFGGTPANSNYRVFLNGSNPAEIVSGGTSVDYSFLAATAFNATFSWFAEFWYTAQS